MKSKITAVILGLLAILGIFALLLFLTGVFSFSHFTSTVVTDISYEKDTGFVTKLAFNAETAGKRSTEEKIMLHSQNSITFQDFTHGAKIAVKIKDKRGKTVFSKKIEENGTYKFEAVSGEGTVKITFYKGTYKGKITFH